MASKNESKKQTTKRSKRAIAESDKRRANKHNRWTDEAVKRYRAAIKAGKETYVTLSVKLTVSPQTVWASLNADRLSKNKAKAKAAKRSRKPATK